MSPPDTERSHSIQRAARRQFRRERKFFEARAAARRRWRDERDGSQGRGPCRRINER
jgi:hypothetical protein